MSDQTVKERIDELFNAYVAGIVEHVDGSVSVPSAVMERLLDLAKGARALDRALGNLSTAMGATTRERDRLAADLRSQRAAQPVVVEPAADPNPWADIPAIEPTEVSDNEKYKQMETMFRDGLTADVMAVLTQPCICDGGVAPAYATGEGCWVCSRCKRVRGIQGAGP